MPAYEIDPVAAVGSRLSDNTPFRATHVGNKRAGIGEPSDLFNQIQNTSDWSADKNSVFNLIRGSDPSPGANTRFENHIVSLFDAELQDQNSNLSPGTINQITDSQFSIAVKNGNIKVSRVKINSGKKINSGDFIKELNIIEGNRFN